MIRPTFDTFNEEWARRIVGVKSSRGIDGFLGIVVTEIEPGRLVAEMEVTEDLITIMGTMHGGCLSAMCDHVLGVVMYPVMPPDYWAATTEFKINLLAPVTDGRVPGDERDHRHDQADVRRPHRDRERRPARRRRPGDVHRRSRPDVQPPPTASPHPTATTLSIRSGIIDDMSDHTYAITHLVGTSADGIDAAIRNGITKAGEKHRNLEWFEVTEIRGYLGRTSEVQSFQVTLKLGFRYDD